MGHYKTASYFFLGLSFGVGSATNNFLQHHSSQQQSQEERLLANASEFSTFSAAVQLSQVEVTKPCRAISWAFDEQGLPVWHRAAVSVKRDDLPSIGVTSDGAKAEHVREQVVESLVAYGQLGVFVDLRSSAFSGVVGVKRDLPVWRISADPHGRPLVWVYELVWTKRDEEGFAEFIRPHLKSYNLMTSLNQRGRGHWEVGAHRFFASVDPANVMPETGNALSFGQEQEKFWIAPNFDDSDCEDDVDYCEMGVSPTYLMYAVDIADHVAGAERNDLAYVRELLEKPTWTKEEAGRVVIHCSVTIMADASRHVRHFGITTHDAAKKQLGESSQLGRYELSLKLHGFSAACVLRDLASIYGSNRMHQHAALAPMARAMRLYGAFLKEYEEDRREAGMAELRDQSEGRAGGGLIGFNLMVGARDYFFGYKDPHAWIETVKAELERELCRG